MKKCSECGHDYAGRYNSRLCPDCKKNHVRKYKRAKRDERHYLDAPRCPVCKARISASQDCNCPADVAPPQYDKKGRMKI